MRLLAKSCTPWYGRSPSLTPPSRLASQTSSWPRHAASSMFPFRAATIGRPWLRERSQRCGPCLEPLSTIPRRLGHLQRDRLNLPQSNGQASQRLPLRLLLLLRQRPIPDRRTPSLARRALTSWTSSVALSGMPNGGQMRLTPQGIGRRTPTMVGIGAVGRMGTTSRPPFLK